MCHNQSHFFEFLIILLFFLKYELEGYLVWVAFIILERVQVNGLWTEIYSPNCLLL